MAPLVRVAELIALSFWYYLVCFFFNVGDMMCASLLSSGWLACGHFSISDQKMGRSFRGPVKRSQSCDHEPSVSGHVRGLKFLGCLSEEPRFSAFCRLLFCHADFARAAGHLVILTLVMRPIGSFVIRTTYRFAHQLLNVSSILSGPDEYIQVNAGGVFP